MRRDGSLKRTVAFKWGVVVLMWTYSGFHFLKTGVVFALGNFMGDMLYNFPAPVIATWANRSSVFFESQSSALFGSFQTPMWSYGPLFNVVTLPLLFLGPLQDGYRIWLFVNQAFLAAACWLLYRVTMPSRAGMGPLALFGLMVLNYYPFYEALIQRNIEIFEFFLVVGAMAAYAKHREATAGVLIGLATMTKFLPGMFVPYFALKRRWRAFWAALLTLGSIAVLTQLTLGWQHSTLLAQLRTGSYLPYHLNQAVSGAVLRLARAIGCDRYGAIGSQACMAILAVLFGRFMWSIRSSEHWKLEWSLVAIAMIMLPPHNQNYYLIFLLIPYAVLLGEVIANPWEGWSWKLLLATSWVLTAWPIPLSLLHQAFGVTVEQLLALSINLWGITMLVGMLVKRLSESAGTPRSSL